jgi:ribosomal protein S27AE
MEATCCPECGAWAPDDEWVSIDPEDVADLENMGVSHADAVSILECPNCGAKIDVADLLDAQ